MNLTIAQHSAGNKRQKRQENYRALHQITKTKNRVVRDLILNENRHDILCHEIGYRFDPVHELIIHNQLVNITTLQLAPRGWGKSTIGTIISAAMKIIRDPNIRILYASETVTQAQNFLDELKAVLVNPRVVATFGHLQGSVWNEDAITVAGRTLPRKEKTVMTTGVDGSITSSHFDCIYADDLVTLKNSRSELRRRRTREWFYTTLMPCITDESTEFRVSGTRYHPDDLYNHLMVNDPKFMASTSIIPAMVPGTDESNNPTVFSSKFLSETRESMSRPYFNAQFNQNPSGIQGTVFDDKFFRYTKKLPANLVYFTGVDLAVGEDENHAQFAIMTIGINPVNFDIYVCKYYTAHLSLKRQDEVIVEHYDILKAVAVGIESNAFQKSKVKTLKTQKETTHVPAIPIFTTEGKPVRFDRLSVRYERGEIIHLESERGGQLEEQLLDWPNGLYNDLIDSEEIAIETAFRKRKKKKSGGKKFGVIAPGRKRW